MSVSIAEFVDRTIRHARRMDIVGLHEWPTARVARPTSRVWSGCADSSRAAIAPGKPAGERKNDAGAVGGAARGTEFQCENASLDSLPRVQKYFIFSGKLSHCLRRRTSSANGLFGAWPPSGRLRGRSAMR